MKEVSVLFPAVTMTAAATSADLLLLFVCFITVGHLWIFLFYFFFLLVAAEQKMCQIRELAQKYVNSELA